MTQPKILFLASTHGDERFSIPILRSLESEFLGSFDWFIANERARARNVRFTEADLNRSAPGNPASPLYEMRRAYEILEIAKRYVCVIDIHGTTANSGIFVIVTNPSPRNIALAASLPIHNVVIWTAKETQRQGPITRFVPCGLEIECGPKSSPDLADHLRRILVEILWRGFVLDPSRSQTWFRVYGSLTSGPSDLRDFELTEVDEEQFYPLLVSQYRAALCYKMEILDINKLCLF